MVFDWTGLARIGGDIGGDLKVCPNCGEPVKGFIMVGDDFLVFEPDSKAVEGAITWYECPNCGLVDFEEEETP